jgi:hypothetical protein
MVVALYTERITLYEYGINFVTTLIVKICKDAWLSQALLYNEVIETNNTEKNHERLRNQQDVPSIPARKDHRTRMECFLCGELQGHMRAAWCLIF